MAWIESHQDLRNNAKTRRVARRLGVSVPAVIGHLHCLWWWAFDHAFDGDVSAYDAEDLADAAEWDGDAGTFVKTLIDCGPGGKAGFLEPDGRTADGRTAALVLHDWGEFTAYMRGRRNAATQAAHARWHTKRGLVDPGCAWCSEDAAAQPSDAAAQPAQSDTDAHAMPPHANRNAPTEPTEPDQTEPNVKGAASRKRSAQATRLPDDWVPGEEPELQAEATAAGIDLHREFARFGDYWRAQGGQRGRKRDWQATWRNWLRKAIDDRPRSNGHSRDGPSHAERYRQAALEARRREATP